MPDSVDQATVTSQKVVIGIPSFRRPDSLRTLLRSLETQNGLEDLQVEVFVADNDAGRSEACEVCEALAPEYRWPLICAIVSKRGISEARNSILERGLRSKADWIAMIDDDEWAEPDWLAQLFKVQTKSGVDVVGGPLFFRFEDAPSTSVRHCGLFEQRPWHEGEVSVLDATNNVMFSARSLAQAGWPMFDTAFGLSGGEDKEYFLRLRALGLKFGWAPCARVHEPVPLQRNNIGWVLKRSYRIGNSDLRATRINQGPIATAVSLGKALAVLLVAPLAAPLLLSPKRRLRLMCKWSRSVGKFAALGGHQYREYA